MKLIIGNKRYSSWSLRPWLLLRQAGIPFEEKLVWIHLPGTVREIRRYSPGGKVPALIDGRVRVWESLAICEYIAEKYPKKLLWPADPVARAEARSVSHEMHAGFQGLRSNLPCHFINRYRGFRVPAEARPDIERIREIWTEARRRWGKGGPFLYGRFSVADAMYAPVVFRYLAYGVKLDPVSAEYVRTIEALPAMQEWLRAAVRETRRIAAYERPELLP